ncbi:MAG: ABC transporter permease [Burkholderiales bacterium]
MKWIKLRIQGFLQYKELLKQLVSRDIKLKYRRSFLGYLWSVLNPLLIMMVLSFVFAYLFEGKFAVPNFAVYLLTGQVIFNFMSESTSLAIGSITTNAALIKKTYVPKYIFTVSKVTSTLVNFLFSMVALWIVMLVTGVRITLWFLMFPVIIIEVYIFSLGLGLFLAQAAVFFRDIQYIYGVLLTAWMYMTPLFYPIDILHGVIRNVVLYWNPMYYYVKQFRDAVLYGQMSEPYLIIGGVAFAIVFLALGIITFVRNQDKFILYI